MICTNVVLCLSSGLAKNNKIMSKFVLFPSHFESLVIFSKMGGGGGGRKPYTKAVKRDVFVDFSKVQKLNSKFFKNCGYFD